MQASFGVSIKREGKEIKRSVAQGAEIRKRFHKAILIQQCLLILLILSFFLCSAGAAETDISSQVQVKYASPIFNLRTGTQSYSASLINGASASYAAPVKLVIDNISPSQVTVATRDGTTADGKPYFDFSNLLGDGTLAKLETSTAKTILFNNPTRIRFTFQGKVLAESQVGDTTQILITNPVNGGSIADTTPYITASFSDTLSGIDPDSCNILINGVDQTSFFQVLESGAACQKSITLPTGSNTITVSVANNYGLSSTASAQFTVSQSVGTARYLFILKNNPWASSPPATGPMPNI